MADVMVATHLWCSVIKILISDILFIAEEKRNEEIKHSLE